MSQEVVFRLPGHGKQIGAELTAGLRLLHAAPAPPVLSSQSPPRLGLRPSSYGPGSWSQVTVQFSTRRLAKGASKKFSMVGKAGTKRFGKELGKLDHSGLLRDKPTHAVVNPHHISPNDFFAFQFPSFIHSPKFYCVQYVPDWQIISLSPSLGFAKFTFSVRVGEHKELQRSTMVTWVLKSHTLLTTRVSLNYSSNSFSTLEWGC